MELKDFEIYRVIEDRGGEYKVSISDGVFIYTFDRLVKNISERFRVDDTAIKNDVRYINIKEKIIQKYNSDDNYIIIIVHKRDKNSEQIKKEIKEITNDLTKLILTITEIAYELKVKQDISGWLWNRAIFNFKKCKFTKVD